MRKPAEIFKLIVDREIYSYTCPYMCYALRKALGKGLISREEHRECKLELGSYLIADTLVEHLNYLGKVTNFTHWKRIYLDWDNKEKTVASLPDNT
jgi:hypothetical protein